MSKAMSANGASSYFEKDNYYIKDGVTEKGVWQGNLANAFGLSGIVEKNTFFALVSGYSHNKLTNEQTKELSALNKEASKLTEAFEKSESVLNGVRNEIEKEKAQKNKDEIILQIKEYNEKKEAFDRALPEGVKLIQDGRNKAGVIEHRAGFDVTFSASKSVSTVALVLGDDRLIQAHKEAVETALRHIEQYGAQGRIMENGERRKENTDSLAIAKFTHYSSRGAEGQIPDPQLHTHGFVLNMTQTSTGLKALEPREIYKMQRESGQIYQNELAHAVEKLGYAVEWTKEENGNFSFEIKGIKQELKDEFSKRTKQIETHLNKLEKSLGRPLTTAEKQAYKMDVRETKKAQDLDKLKEGWLETAKELNQETNLEVIRNSHTSDKKLAKDVNEVVAKAIEHLEANKSVFSEREILAEASKISSGLSSLKEIKEAIKTAEKTLLDDGRFTTQKVLENELKIINEIENGKGREKSLMTKSKLDYYASKSKNYEGLTNGQKQAIEHIATSRDSIIAIQGDAGTGKTASMKVLNELLGDQVHFIGLAPTGKAAQELKEHAGFDSITIDRFLLLSGKKETNGDDLRTSTEKAQDSLHEANLAIRSFLPKNFGTRIDPLNILGKTVAYGVGKLASKAMHGATNTVKESAKELVKKEKVFIIDEASMISTLNMSKLIDAVKEMEGRLVFMGDIKQLNAVEQGKMFEKIQKHASTITMSEVLRQRTAETKEFANAMKEGNADKALQNLESRGKLIENSDRQLLSKSLIERASKDFVRNLKETIVLTASNKSKDEFNKEIRKELVKKGVVMDGKKATVLVAKPLGHFDKKIASSYNIGDVLIANKHQGDLKSGGKAYVVGIDKKENKVAIHYENSKGEFKTREIDAEKMKSFSVYERKELHFGTHDRIMFTKNDKDMNVKNGDIVSVKHFDGEYLRVQTHGKNTREFNVDIAKYQHLSHAYAVTTHKSQGASIDNVHIYAFSKTGMETMEAGYVESTRAKQEVTVYTDDKEQLKESWGTKALKENASDFTKEVKRDERIQGRSKAEERQRQRDS